MIKLATAASLLIAAAAPAFAQEAAPAAAPAASAAATAPVSTARLNLDTPIEAIVADTAGKAVLDADFPGMTTHAMYDMFKTMSLRQVQPMSNGAITDEALKKAEADLAAVK